MKRRKLNIEKLEDKKLLHAGHFEAVDVNDDGIVSANDALIAINHLYKRNNEYNENTDVNIDARNSALDVLIIINHIQEEIPQPDPDPPQPDPDPPEPPKPRYLVTFRVSNNISTVGYTKKQIMEAIEQAFQEYEKVGDVDFVITNKGKYSISSDELWLGRYYGPAYQTWHARGWVLPRVGGTTIQIHNGKIKAAHSVTGEDRDWKAFSSQDAMKRILQHEIGHAVMSWHHSNDRAAVMNINASSSEFNAWEVDQIIRRWGKSQR